VEPVPVFVGPPPPPPPVGGVFFEFGSRGRHRH
jgi:hypothetical protein